MFELPSTSAIRMELSNKWLQQILESINSYISEDLSIVPMLKMLRDSGRATFLVTNRLGTVYRFCNLFKMFTYAVCQVKMQPGKGISVHTNSSLHGRLRPWDGPFLCPSCHDKKEAMEGKRPL